eukprot:TRINITY_DN6930_c0_g1_i1.p1 TRINITY_DN6930_c0_g1~~TRINITY_DN6930_c0_g1_i1.p1  ORF type:complete len:335 (-),score=77.28 TRINITY_DN6930_c0_g1_i1:105-1109(-)
MKKIGFMKSCTAFAPGKIIVLGEHFVVYGTKCLVTAIDLTTKCICERNERDIMINLDSTFLSVPFDHLNDLDTLVSSENPLYLGIKCIIGLIKHVDANIKPITHGFTFSYETSVRIGSGLGSSASFCVSTAAALLKFLDVISNCNDLNDLELINDCAFLMESVGHGKVSGVDNTVTCYGGTICFQNGDFVHRTLPNIPMLLIDTGIPKNTKKQVEIFKNNVDIHSKEFKEACRLLDSRIDNVLDNFQFCNFREAVSSVQQMLKLGGVSCAEIDEIVDFAEKHSCVAKLVGAGGGGFVVAFHEDMNVLLLLQEDLKRLGYESFTPHLGVEGVKFE